MESLDHLNVIKTEELKMIVGGISFPGSFLSAFSSSITKVYNLGRAFGSSLRRAFTGNICRIR